MMRSYRVMAVCQMNPVDGRTFWLARNQMRLQGLETKYYGNRVMKWVFEGTPLQTLEPLLVSSNCYMFAKELDSIKQIVSCAQKYNWMTPIAVVMDDRIFSMAEIQKLAQLSSLSMLPAQTVAVLASIPRQATQALDHHARNLVASLGHIANMKKDES
uniref:Large ribosomal subunit protein uL10m n=1 Tax=Plectus sambesii TaxID=2011161 RepID=A0A914V109_9BILA